MAGGVLTHEIGHAAVYMVDVRIRPGFSFEPRRPAVGITTPGAEFLSSTAMYSAVLMVGPGVQAAFAIAVAGLFGDRLAGARMGARVSASLALANLLPTRKGTDGHKVLALLGLHAGTSVQWMARSIVIAASVRAWSGAMTGLFSCK